MNLSSTTNGAFLIRRIVRRLASAALLVAVMASPPSSVAQERQGATRAGAVPQPLGSVATSPRRAVVAFGNSISGLAWLQPMSIKSPWSFQAPPIEVGVGSTLRYHSGRVFAVSSMDSTITIVDALDWTVIVEYSLGASVEPLDIAVVNFDTAFVSDAAGGQLLVMDLVTGAINNSIDLNVFGDNDGNPDAGMMVLHSGRLFVQLRRYDATAPNSFQSPALLAVVDVATEQVVDVDPIAPGMQGIALQGTPPKHKMQLRPGSNELVLSASGDLFDFGGIERVDLITLQSVGFIVQEFVDDVGADLGSFVLVDQARGYLVFSTDLLPSSHLREFTISGGVTTDMDAYASVSYLVPSMVHDVPTNTLFFPDGGSVVRGVHVFDAETAERLTKDLLVTDGVPTDILIACGFDNDGDGDVDLEDYASFQVCLDASGPNGGIVNGCGCLDVDGSENITLRDFSVMQIEMGSGSSAR